MKILLDSHILLWSVLEPHKLPKNIYTILDKNKYPSFISIASLWEIAIKANVGKLHLPEDFFNTIANSDTTILNITPTRAIA